MHPARHATVQQVSGDGNHWPPTMHGHEGRCLQGHVGAQTSQVGSAATGMAGRTVAPRQQDSAVAATRAANSLADDALQLPLSASASSASLGDSLFEAAITDLLQAAQPGQFSQETTAQMQPLQPRPVQALTQTEAVALGRQSSFIQTDPGGLHAPVAQDSAVQTQGQQLSVAQAAIETVSEATRASSGAQTASQVFG